MGNPRCPHPEPPCRKDGRGPSAQVWWLSCAITTLIFVATYFISKKLIPVIYLLRAVLLVQAIALLYFALIPARFPHTPDSYLTGFVTSGIGLISLVPFIFGLTYYIFDFGLLRKALLTSTTRYFFLSSACYKHWCYREPYCSCRCFTLSLACPSTSCL